MKLIIIYVIAVQLSTKKWCRSDQYKNILCAFPRDVMQIRIEFCKMCNIMENYFGADKRKKQIPIRELSRKKLKTKNVKRYFIRFW